MGPGRRRFAFDTTDGTAKTGDAANISAKIDKDDELMSALELRLHARLHAKQGAAFTSSATEILYGGTAGGSKSGTPIEPKVRGPVAGMPLSREAPPKEGLS